MEQRAHELVCMSFVQLIGHCCCTMSGVRLLVVKSTGETMFVRYMRDILWWKLLAWFYSVVTAVPYLFLLKNLL